MNLTGTDYEGQPHPAAEEADVYERSFVPSVDTNPPKSWETETRYLIRFEEDVFKWKYEQERAGAPVSDVETAKIFDNFFSHLAKHPVLPTRDLTLTQEHMTRERLSLSIGEMRSNAKLDKGDPYVGTTRGRNFFWPEGSLKPYVATLFGIKEDVYYSGSDQTEKKGATEYITSKIKGKDILNIGGKNMTKDLLTKGDIMPKSFVNIDPYIDSEDIDMNSKDVYRSVGVSAVDADIGTKLSESEVPTEYDEIWASFSVPVYLSSTQEISRLFKNIRHLLKVKGVARMFPLSLAVQEDSDMIVEESAVQIYHVWKRALMDEILELSKDEAFAVDVIPAYKSDYSSSTNMLLIQRLK